MNVNGNMTTEMQVVSPAVALDWLNQYPYEHQRPVRKNHVNFLAKEMAAGHFGVNTLRLMHCAENGNTYLINGQHTLNAIVQAGVTLKLPVLRHNVKLMTEVAEAYGETDRGLKRTASDTYRASGLLDEFKMNSSYLDRYSAAVTLILADFVTTRSRAIDDYEKIDAMRAWRPELIQYQGYVADTALAVIAKRSDMCAIGLLTCRYVKDVQFVQDFWHYVVTDDGLRVGDPRKTLYNWLGNENMHVASSGTRALDVRVRAIANAWNAYCDGRELKLIKVINPTVPFALKRTPYRQGAS